MKVEVVEVNEKNVLAAFSGEIKMKNILDFVASESRSIVTEAETELGRKEIASIAYKVSRSKTLIDGVGKDMVSLWKEKAKAVDAQRKKARDFLDDLRDEIRKPVTEWEAEQKLLQEELIRKEEEEQAARLAELERREAELKAREEEEEARKLAVKLEADRKEREEGIAKEAAERAKKEAEESARQEKEAAARREREAIEAKELVERDAKEAAEFAKLREEQAKRQADEDKRQAIERERERARLEKQREEDAQKKREADVAHKKSVNNSACTALIAVGLSEADSKKAVIAIAKGQVPNVRIGY